MIDADRKPFSVVMLGVFELYGKKLSDPILAIWWGAMRPFDFPAVKDALNRHVVNPDNGQFLPKPADVVKLIGGSTLDAALLAWSKVDAAVRSVGTYESVCFDDPIINTAIKDMGGWVQLGQKTEDEWPFVAKEFETRYRGYRARGHMQEWPRYLPGRAEGDNVQRGYASELPVLIGDRDTARAVFQGGSASPQLGFVRAQIQHEEAA